MGFPPQWFLILEAAGHDPLRAQEIEEKVNQVWWERWKADRNARAEASQKNDGR